MATRQNPYGLDLAGLGWKALGLAGSGALADKFIWPAVRNIAPGQGAASQIAHGLATLATAILLGKGVGMLGQRSIGKDLAEGGGILGVGEMAAAVIPGFTVSGTFPTALPSRAVSPALLPAATNSPALSAPTVTGRVYPGM